jgi:hypothetical protein
MIDAEILLQEIKSEISKRVSKITDDLMSDSQWITKIQDQVVNAIQHRILAKFQNLNEIPGIEKSLEQAVANVMTQNSSASLAAAFDSAQVQRLIDDSVQVSVQQCLDQLILDQSWLDKIQEQIDRQMTSKVSRSLSLHDIPTLISDTVQKHMQQWVDEIKNQSPVPSIVDIAANPQLTILDGTVVIENELATNSATIVNSVTVKGHADINDLIVRGSINTDNHSWDELANTVAKKTLDSLTAQWRQDMLTGVLDLAKTQGLDFHNITVNQQPLVTENRLGSQITESSLVQVGTLRDLAVAGNTALNETLNVHRKRVGINTNSPEMALSIWDEEVSITAGKISRDRAWLGTGRRQALSIGVDRVSALDIDSQGQVVIKNLRVDRFQIGHAQQVPGWSGTRGDFILNSDPKPDTPFAWVCLGGFKWQPLKSA